MKTRLLISIDHLARPTLSLVIMMLLLVHCHGGDEPKHADGTNRSVRAQREGRPNVILVISDDHDYEHLGFAGGRGRSTPQIDQLAALGITFRVAHTQSRCRPTLAGLLTGLPPHRSEVFFNFESDTRARRRQISGDAHLLPKMLRDSGYLTFAQGKVWERPSKDYGFDYGSGWDDDFVRTSQEELFSFLEGVKDQPFFVWWAPALPHRPHNPPDRLRRQFPAAEVAVPAWIRSQDREKFREAEAVNFAMEAWLDEGFGQLMSKLETESLIDETLIIFLIDNGWSNGFVSKGSPYEKGIRTPIVVNWKGQIQAGRQTSALASYLDVMPTVLDFANIDRPRGLPGKSLRPIIEGQSQTLRTELMGAVYPAFQSSAQKAGDAAVALYIRTENTKYIYWLKDINPALNEFRLRIKHFFVPFPNRRRGHEELYDLSLDPYEHRNLANNPQYEETRVALKTRLLGWWESETH